MSNRTETEIARDMTALDASIAQGVTSYSYDGRSVTYRSIDEMITARMRLSRELANLLQMGGPQTRSYAIVSRGY